MKQKELEEQVKSALIVKYGYNEFKATWEQIGDVLNMKVPQATYHINKLIETGFLQLIQKAERENGYWTPNIFKISHNSMSIDDITHANGEVIFRDIYKEIKKMSKIIENTKDLLLENQRLRQELVASQAREKKLFNEALELRQKLLEITNLK